MGVENSISNYAIVKFQEKKCEHVVYSWTMFMLTFVHFETTSVHFSCPVLSELFIHIVLVFKKRAFWFL